MFAPVFVVVSMSVMLVCGRTFLKPYLHFEHWGVFPVEQLSDAFWVILFGVFFYYRKNFDSLTDFSAGLFLSFVLFMRELGAHHWLASKDSTAFKIHFFTNPDNPLHEKLIAGAIVIVILTAAGYLLYRYVKPLIVGFFKLNPLCWTLATFGGFGIVCKIADRLPSIYSRRTGVAFTQDTVDFFSLTEETGEMLLPLLLMLALYQMNALKKAA